MIKFEVENLDGVEEGHQSLYVKMESGKYQLAVDGAVPRSKFIEFRDSNIEFKRQLDEIAIDETRRKEDDVRKNGEFETLSQTLTTERDELLLKLQGNETTLEGYKVRDEAELAALLLTVPENMQSIVNDDSLLLAKKLELARTLSTVKPGAPGPKPVGVSEVALSTLSAKEQLILHRRNGQK